MFLKLILYTKRLICKLYPLSGFNQELDQGTGRAGQPPMAPSPWPAQLDVPNWGGAAGSHPCKNLCTRPLVDNNDQLTCYKSDFLFLISYWSNTFMFKNRNDVHRLQSFKHAYLIYDNLERTIFLFLLLYFLSLVNYFCLVFEIFIFN